MQIRDLLKGVEILGSNCPMEMEIDAICCDSRKAKPGTVFIAARRTGSDGHDYIASAVEAGASLIVAEHVPAPCTCVLVPDGAQALAKIAANFYGNPADRMKIIGALGYFILPVDLIPDYLPVLGFSDDLAALTWALYSVAKNITPEVKVQAQEQLGKWFKDYLPSDIEGLF